ncbi:MAG: hypothetical protein LBM77_08855 [Spirochaetaceae bacterium]|jgi:hypothetical protein|nr:hypothetical protein [Spirochaetaceae bacterium]
MIGKFYTQFIHLCILFILLLSFSACRNVIIDDGGDGSDSIKNGAVSDGPAAYKGSIQLSEGATEGTLSIIIEDKTERRSVSGFSGTSSDLNTPSPLRNYFELITLDANSGTKIMDFCRVQQTTSPTLKVRVRKGVRTHALLLVGNQYGSNYPTLLGSSFVTFYPDASNDMVTFTITPLVIGVESYEANNREATLQQPGRLSPGITIPESYVTQVNIGNRATALSAGDSRQIVSGDGLAPLVDAARAVGSSTNLNTADPGNTVWNEGYPRYGYAMAYLSVPDPTPVEADIFADYYSNPDWNDTGDCNPDTVPFANLVEQGIGINRNYQFTLYNNPGDISWDDKTLWDKIATWTYRFVFRIDYRPFELDETAWQDANGDFRKFIIDSTNTPKALDEVPHWIIRPGLNDDVKTPLVVDGISATGYAVGDYGTDYAKFNDADTGSISGAKASYKGLPVNANGGIPVPINSGARTHMSNSPHTIGIYEEDNLYPAYSAGNTDALYECLKYLEVGLSQNPSARKSSYYVGVTTYENPQGTTATNNPINCAGVDFDTDRTGFPNLLGSNKADYLQGTGGKIIVRGMSVANWGAAVNLSSEGYLLSLPDGAGIDVVLEGDLTINGKNDNTSPLIYVGEGNTLTIGEYADWSGLITNDEGVIIRGNTYQGNGAGILVAGSNAIFTMDGGAIQDCHSTNGKGGAVFVSNGASFVFNNGIIGGTYAVTANNATTTTYNGSNSAVNGGAVAIDAQSSLAMNNGIISYNTASANGGAVYLAASAKFKLNGGEIYNNTASAGAGGGVYLDTGADFSITGGIIYGKAGTTFGTSATYTVEAAPVVTWPQGKIEQKRYGNAASTANTAAISGWTNATYTNGDQSLYAGSL